MPRGNDHRPGVAYRRPNGAADRLVVESSNELPIPVGELGRSSWLDAVHHEDRERLRSALHDDQRRVDVAYRLVTDDETWIHERGRFVDAAAADSNTGDSTNTDSNDSANTDTDPNDSANPDHVDPDGASNTTVAGGGRGDVVGYLFLAGERVERERQLEIQRERLEEFASVVSHDLRNPLSVAVGNLEVAADLDGDAATERIARAQDALGRMDELIGDLLALAREGQTVEETSETDLRTVVDRAWGTVGGEAAADLHVTDPLPRIECDRGRVRQVIENLFRNANEHGADEPQIEVGMLADGTGFYVADDGPGIDPDVRERVFDPGHTTTQDGTGFGLAIVERIAEAHGWSVDVTESQAGGARFELSGVDIVSTETKTTPTLPGSGLRADR
ncbi:hypothetical protein JCM18237_03830 [Halorubrum luteum]